MASSDHVHAESQVLPVDQHLRLLSAQYLSRALMPHHTSFASASLGKGPRNLKETLRSKCIDLVEPSLVDGVVPARDFKQLLSNIHTKVVSDVIDAFQPNRVLGLPPPLVDPSEKSLPRATRATLSQLRSGHCAKLNTYLARLGRLDSDNCPDCNSAPHSPSHLFSCPAHPTNLVTTDLWEKPWDVAVFLASLPSFNSLPDPGPPPPPRHRPRRRPPPRPPD